MPTKKMTKRATPIITDSIGFPVRKYTINGIIKVPINAIKTKAKVYSMSSLKNLSILFITESAFS